MIQKYHESKNKDRLGPKASERTWYLRWATIENCPAFWTQI